MFTIRATELHWLPGNEETEDLCLHGHAVVTVGDERMEFHATVSATALYLLKSLSEDHRLGEGLQMLPCCGHFLIANETLTQVEIIGCDNGVDFSVTHEGDGVRLTTASGHSVCLPLSEYRREVFAFADMIEHFYHGSKPKKLPTDEFCKNGYLAFWKEWKTLREQ